MKKTSKALVAVILFLLVSLAACGADSGGSGETFRSAKVIAVQGTAALVRGDTSMEVYEGLVLQGGDQIITAGGGRVDLKLDEDKFVVLEEHTAVTFSLEGDPQKGAIRLYQTSGTIHHSIENPLSDEDSYEVHTPEAVMAVRGTDFFTIVLQTEGGGQTSTEVREGNVEMIPDNPEEPPKNLGPGDQATVGRDENGAAHFLTVCPGCRLEVDTQEDHLLACEHDHYSCDGNAHDALACGHFACAEGDHETELACGHFACAEGDHETKLACGHPACAEGDHETKLACGHPACAEGDHETKLACGHPACAEGSHQKLHCQNYGCQPGHQSQNCGHCVCDQEFWDHSRMACGHYACNIEDLGHYLLPCGNYDCSGGGHALCYVCEACVCTGDHSEYPCGHRACGGGAHDPLPCGHFTCSEGSHEALACDHYACDGKDHYAYLDCGNLLCADGHIACVYCGQCVCTGAHGDRVCNLNQ